MGYEYGRQEEEMQPGQQAEKNYVSHRRNKGGGSVSGGILPCSLESKGKGGDKRDSLPRSLAVVFSLFFFGGGYNFFV